MKNKAALAEYRIEGELISKAGFDALGISNDHYLLPMNGNTCRVIISNMFGDEQISSYIELTEELGRLPNYEECLKIKDIFYEEDEIIVFGISRNPLMNMTVENPWAIHMYKYNGPMPPIKKIMEIDDFKVDGDFKITRGKGWGWHFVRICGEHYPNMDEICNIKEKYASDRDVAVFLIKDAVILFSNPKSGITFNFHTMK